MRNLIAVIIFLFWIPVTLVAQINREFKTAKVYGDVAQATEKLYENVPLDPAGVPILNQAPTQESLNFYENGQMIETQQFDIEKGEKTLSVRILLKRKAGTVHTADVYTYYSGKESLLRSHVGTIENGRLVSEKIIKKQKEIGVFQYFYSTNTQGLEVERIETKDDRVHGKYYTESDKFGTVLSLQIFENDTIMRQILLDRQGEEYSKYLLISSSRSTGRIDSVLVTERNWLDSNGNTTLNLKQMEALTTPPDGEPRTANFVVAFSYVSSKNAPKKVQTSAT